MSGTSFVAMWEGTPASVEDGRGEQLLPGHSKQLFIYQEVLRPS